jgi:hypothetical protein
MASIRAVVTRFSLMLTANSALALRYKALLVHKAIRDRKVRLELSVHRVPQDQLAQSAQRVQLAQPEHRGCKDFRVRKVLRVQPGTGPQGPAGPITHGSVVMLSVVNNVTPPAPAGYSLAGFTQLFGRPNGNGPPTNYAVYTKN